MDIKYEVWRQDSRNNKQLMVMSTDDKAEASRFLELMENKYTMYSFFIKKVEPTGLCDCGGFEYKCNTFGHIKT